MITETETDYNTLAAYDAEQRDLSGIELPTREEVENGRPTPKDTPQRFAIVDEESADWFLEKLADIEAKKARIIANTKRRVDELDADARALHNRFDAEFQAFCEQEATRRRRKTITLPNGCGAFRTVPAKLVITDGPAAMQYAATERTDFLIETTTTRLDTAAYVAEAERTGEMFPGLDRHPEREAFKIDTGTSRSERATDGGAKPKGKANPDEAGD